MTRIYLIVSIMVVLFGSVLVLDTYRATRTVQAQADPNAPAAPLKTYLPLISLSVPTPTSHIKERSAIHMGNRGLGKDWQDKFFRRLRGTTEGKWPAATVLLSSQLYAVERSTISPCLVSTVTVRAPVLYAYLTEAIQNKTKVVIRIYPSPGNFKDYAHPGRNHELRTDKTPAGVTIAGMTNAKNLSNIET